MTAFTPGTGSIQVTSWENYLAALIWSIQAVENDSAKNPSGINYLTSSASDDGSKTLTASFSCPAAVDVAADGAIAVSCTAPYSGLSFQTGGDAKAGNILAALIEATVKVRLFELTASKNPNAYNYVNWTLSPASSVAASASGTFSANYALPTAFAVNSQGQQVRDAVNYLL